MADNYLQFSFVVPATPEEAGWLIGLHETCQDRMDLKFGNEGCDDEVYSAEAARCLAGDLYPTVEVSFDDGYLWFHSDPDGDIEYTANLVHEFLAHFQRDDRVGIEYACTCSRPRIGEFSGGAAFVTSAVVEFMTTGEWLAQRASLEDVPPGLQPWPVDQVP